MKGHFECSKIAYRQTKDGVAVTLLLHPNDVSGDFAASPLGTVFIIGYATPDEGESPPATQQKGKSGDLTGGGPGGVIPGPLSSGARAVQMAGILCADEQFQNWLLRESDRSDRPSIMETVGEWEKWATAEVRRRCNIISRRELATDELARARWAVIETAFRQATGQFAEDRG